MISGDGEKWLTVLPQALLSMMSRLTVDELENGIQRALLLSDDDLIEPDHVEIEPRSGTRIALNQTDSPTSSPKADGAQSDISSLEREHILRVLSQVKGNRKEAISILGISERALRYKLKAYKEAGYEFDWN